MKTRHVPFNLNVTAIATYSQSVNGATKITETKFRLPLKLVMKSGKEKSEEDTKGIDSKSNLKKIVLETNRPCVNLNEIFPEFSSSYTSSNMIIAQYFGHSNMSMLIQGAKTGSYRYRIQAENFEYLWILTQEFVIRLNSYYSKLSQDVEIKYLDPLPTDEFRQVIDRHLQLRQTIEKNKEILEQYCVQFRAIQKRLLSKFKDKSPTSLDNLDSLLEATFRQVSLVSEVYLNTQRELSLVNNSLNCISSLYVMLVSLAFKFSKESIDVLESVLACPIKDTADLGWEEIVNVSVANLLKTTLSKSNKDQTGQTQLAQSLKIPTDSSKIEEQIKSLVSKLESGASLSSFNKRSWFYFSIKHFIS